MTILEILTRDLNIFPNLSIGTRSYEFFFLQANFLGRRVENPKVATIDIRHEFIKLSGYLGPLNIRRILPQSTGIRPHWPLPHRPFPNDPPIIAHTKYAFLPLQSRLPH